MGQVRRAAPVLVLAATLVALALESHAQTVVFSDQFTRPNNLILFPGWIDADAGGSEIYLNNNLALFDLDIGPGNGVDLAHGVTIDSFGPRGIKASVYTQETPLSGGYTSPHGIHLAYPSNSDADHFRLYLQGEGDGWLDAYLLRPDPSSSGTLLSSQNNVALSDGSGYNQLEIEINVAGTLVTARLGGSPLFGGALLLDPTDLLPLVTVKIGNLGADGDSGFGSGREGDVRMDIVLVRDDDLDDDGVANASDNCPNAANAGQEDTDSDGVGNACNSAIDLDGDEWNDGLDNCPDDSNPGQEDSDSDLAGDVCDHDPDPTLFSDDFDRVDSSGLGPSWLEAESAASKFSISGGLGLLDPALGGGVGVDIAHAVTAQSFAPAALRVRASVRETPLSGGFTIQVGLGLADPGDDDLDILMFWLVGDGDGLFDASLYRPDPAGAGAVTDLSPNISASIAPSDGIGFNELTLEVASDRTSVRASLNGVPIFISPLDPADLPSAVTVKIGNPGADGDSGAGSARLGDVEYGLVRVIDADPDMDDDGMGDEFEQANGFDPLDADENMNGTVDGQDDEDSDGLGNAAEALAGTDPKDNDTDNDGLLDGAEIGTGSFSAQQVISTLADAAQTVFAADVDGDGDIDVLSASQNDDKIAWYENTDGLGGFGGQQVISTLADGAVSVFAADVDGDGDADVLSASFFDDVIAWYENTDGLGGFGGQQVISDFALFGAISVFAADVDGDGDEDAVSASFSDNEISWYENTDGLGGFGGQQLISTLADGPQSVFAADVDGDGDTDVLSAGSNDDEIAWYENTDGQGSFGVQQVISTLADAPISIFAADVDGDGDTDVLSGSVSDDEVAWYENTDGQGSFGAQQVIATLAHGAEPVSVFAADVDGDGDLDLLSASQLADEIAWYEHLNVADPLDPDSDDDGLLDGAEIAAGTGVFDPDSDDDGLLDGDEVAAGADPLDPDSDGDGVCDGGSQVGSCTAAGPDNCPNVANPTQTNSDALPEGNACQCGDVNSDGAVNAADRTSFQAWLVGNSGGGAFFGERCNVIGPSQPAPGYGCGIADIYVISRFVDGAPVSVGNDCPAFRP